MASGNQEIAFELLPLLRVYKDGRVERLIASEIVPSSLQDPETGVSSKDIIISSPDPSISARLYLPNINKLATTNSTQQHQKLPLLIYFHGGAFCIGSVASFLHQRYLNLLVSQANVVAVSVEYRLAPEHPLPTAYEDCWAALQWVLSHSKKQEEDLQHATFNHGFNNEPWLIDYVDFSRVFLGGDSAGANIAHNVAMRVTDGLDGLRSIRGAFLVHPYFWGSDPIGSETGMDPGRKSIVERIWLFVSPLSSDGIDDPMFNPFAPGAPSLSGLGCEKVLVCVAGKDTLIERGRFYCEKLKSSGWEGEVELFENEEEGHAFHIYDPATKNAQLLIKRLALFLNH
ncbi:Alpha/beta hydrolase fold-3 [Macleaya cordata]|uniref:Alpha/beta hydrolase fold-3 n=1 Tax=Macleaya cordata TaxID=56857 RepID=A0A200QQ19_MACCD|nr:Alpha/beta hydrolase fold-3 [Macleaya cordata]